MNGKIIATVLVGIEIGLALPFTGNHQDAIAQQEKATKWEYNVVRFGFYNANDLAKLMDGLAAERWEYVGFVGVPPGNKGSFEGGGNVAFKREKR